MKTPLSLLVGIGSPVFTTGTTKTEPGILRPAMLPSCTWKVNISTAGSTTLTQSAFFMVHARSFHWLLLRSIKELARQINCPDGFCCTESFSYSSFFSAYETWMIFRVVQYFFQGARGILLKKSKLTQREQYPCTLFRYFKVYVLVGPPVIG